MVLPAAMLFDMDGTIVDNMGVHTDVWLELLEKHGVKVSGEDFFRDTAGMTNPKILAFYFGDKLSAEEVSTFAFEKEALYRERYAPKVAAMPGLKEFLKEAKGKGIRTGLATSAPPQNIEFILTRAGLTEAFDVIVGSKDVTHGKPDPEVYLVSAEKLGVKPADCVVFEDAPMGIESGLNAGMRVLVMTTLLTHDQAMAMKGVEAAMPDFFEAKRYLEL